VAHRICPLSRRRVTPPPPSPHVHTTPRNATPASRASQGPIPDEILRTHPPLQVGNVAAGALTGHTLVLGVGSTQLLNAAVWAHAHTRAQAPAPSTSLLPSPLPLGGGPGGAPRVFTSQVPYYSGYPAEAAPLLGGGRASIPAGAGMGQLRHSFGGFLCS